MTSRLSSLIGFCLAAVPFVSIACAAKAATISTNVTVCGRSIELPQVLPPAGSGPVVLMAVPCISPFSDRAASIPQAYRRYVELQPSRPLDGVWIPFDDSAKRMMEADYRRLWDSGRISDLGIEVLDYQFSNGVVGKFVTYKLQER